MSDVIKFDVSTGRVSAYLKSVNTPDFQGRPGVLVNPALPKDFVSAYAVVDKGVVRNMTSAERSVAVTSDKAIEAGSISEGTFDVRKAIIMLLRWHVERGDSTLENFVEFYKTRVGAAGAGTGGAR